MMLIQIYLKGSKSINPLLEHFSIYADLKNNIWTNSLSNKLLVSNLLGFSMITQGTLKEYLVQFG